MYRPAIAASARNGILLNGSLDALFENYHAIARMFEMYIADVLSLERGVPFRLWEHLDRAIKDARGMSYGDTGIDVTDGAMCIVQCKLRHGSLSLGECSTFFASAVALRANPIVLQWSDLIVARNACSKLSRNLEFMRATPKDMPVQLSAFKAYVAECLAAHPQATPVGAPADVDLRDYQIDAINLCCAEPAQGPVYIVLPTGTGKNLVIARSAARILLDQHATVLVLAPLISVADQIETELVRHGIDVDYVGDGRRRTESVESARCTVCVFASAHLVNTARYTRVFVDEAHMARPVDTEHEESADLHESADTDYRTVGKACTLARACLLSATLDVPAHAPLVTLDLRTAIRSRYLCDFQFHVPVFGEGETDLSLARYLVSSFTSTIVFAMSRAKGNAFAALLNTLAVDGGTIARFIDCETPSTVRRELIGNFRTGLLPILVCVRVLATGFDAPITSAVCFLHTPASGTQIVQIIGRALRLHPDKQMAAVVLPFVGDADRNAGAKRARDFFRAVARVDSEFARRGGEGFVDVTHETEGLPGPMTEGPSDRATERPRDRRPEVPEGDAAALLREEIFSSLGVALRDMWEASKDAYVAYLAAHDGEIPPVTGVDGWIGRWVGKQRSNQHTMSAEHRSALNEIGFWWKAADAVWERTYTRLVRHVATHGAMPTTRNDQKLHNWAYRQSIRRAELSEGQIRKLEAIRPDFFASRTGPALAHTRISTAAELCGAGSPCLSLFTLLRKKP